MPQMIDLVTENDTSFKDVLNKYFMQNIDEICGDLTELFQTSLKSQSSDVFLFLLFQKFKQEQIHFKRIKELTLSGNYTHLPQTRRQQQKNESQLKRINRTRRGTSEPRGPFESTTLDPRGQSEFRAFPNEPSEPPVNEEPESWEDIDEIKPLPNAP